MRAVADKLTGSAGGTLRSVSTSGADTGATAAGSPGQRTICSKTHFPGCISQRPSVLTPPQGPKIIFFGHPAAGETSDFSAVTAPPPKPLARPARTRADRGRSVENVLDGVLGLFTGLLHVRRSLVSLAFGFQALVVGDLAGRFLAGILDLVADAHRDVLSRNGECSVRSEFPTTVVSTPRRPALRSESTVTTAGAAAALAADGDPGMDEVLARGAWLRPTGSGMGRPEASRRPLERLVDAGPGLPGRATRSASPANRDIGSVT